MIWFQTLGPFFFVVGIVIPIAVMLFSALYIVDKDERFGWVYAVIVSFFVVFLMILILP